MEGASGLSNKLAASSQGWKWRYTSCEAVLFFHGQSLLEYSQTEKRCSVWRRPADLQCTAWWVRSDGSPSPLGVWHFNLLSQQTNGQSAVASAWTEVWLQLDQKPIFCPSNLCKPHPHSTTVLSHRAEWLQPLWLASICIHSYSTLYLPLISHPPLHFPKLRCNFVSLQWDHPSALPVDCHLVSYSCRACSLLVLQWMTIQGHICTTFRYLCLDSFASCWCYPRSLHACEKQKESQYTSPHMESANSQLDDATADRHIDI